MRAHGIEVELEHVLRRRAHTRQRLERQRPELPAVRRLVGRGLELVREELLEDRRIGAQHADVRAEPLVGAAGDHVRAEAGEVVAAVGRGVDGVDVDARADAVRGGDDVLDVRDGADRVGGGGDRDPLVRSDSTASTAEAGSSSVPSVGSAKRTVTPARSAAITHGRTLESWSRREQTISSPGSSARTTVAAKRIVVAVNDGPKKIPLRRRRRAASRRPRGCPR